MTSLENLRSTRASISENIARFPTLLMEDLIRLAGYPYEWLRNFMNLYIFSKGGKYVWTTYPSLVTIRAGMQVLLRQSQRAASDTPVCLLNWATDTVLGGIIFFTISSLNSFSYNIISCFVPPLIVDSIQRMRHLPWQRRSPSLCKYHNLAR